MTLVEVGSQSIGAMAQEVIGAAYRMLGGRYVSTSLEYQVRVRVRR